MPIRINLENLMWEHRIVSTSELSKKSKISRPTIDNWKKGTISRVELGVLEKFCTAFDCEISDLIVLEKGEE